MKPYNLKVATFPLLHQKIALWEADQLLPLLHQHKIPVGQINAMNEVFELPQAKKILLAAADKQGVRQFVGEIEGFSRSSLSIPPTLP